MSKLKIAGIIIAVMAASVFVFLYFGRPHTVINARGGISMTESQSDCTIQVYSGIENIAHAMKAVLHIDIYSNNTYQKWITYKGIKIMQLEFFVEVAK